MPQLSIASLQGVPVGNEKMRHPILLQALFNFMFSCFPSMELCNCRCKILKHIITITQTLDKDITIKEMYLLLFMQLEEDHTDTMKGDIS
jgi:hypothetical protein